MIWVPYPSPSRLQHIFWCLAVVASDTYMAATTAVSQCFWENIITLTILVNTKYLPLAQMNFDKAFGTFWKEGLIWRKCTNKYNKSKGRFHMPTGNTVLKPVRSWPCRSWASQKSPIYFVWLSYSLLCTQATCDLRQSFTFVLYLTLFLTEAMRNRGRYFCLNVVDGSESTTAASLAIIWIIANTWEEWKRKMQGK